MKAPLGVGLIGAGPVTQAIHLPTLARMPEVFRVEHIMDVQADIAETVASGVGARWTSSVDAVMTDPNVDVVAICSPPQFHAEQVAAAIAAGKKAILCEKPFAVSREEATTIADLASRSGTPIVVGAMHTFDPGWVAATQAWGSFDKDVHTIRSTIVLPFNDRYEDWATEMVGRRPASSTGESSPMPTSAKITGAVLGLAVHNLPLVRHFAPEIETIDAARWLDPFGYVITMRGGGRAIELVGYMHKQWRPEWTFDAYSDEASLHVDFTPSYVQAGSATATFATSAGRQSWGPYDSNGYEAEWLHLAELARGESEPRHALSSLIDDVGYAIDIADAAAAAVEKGMAA